ncbi:Protein HAPLESS 2 [Rhynchospora pubera]|uniref:Protein HAPLESS 2 n=1 Tax=Rhynchospora pubera TaxID=906938 RepID=A0AAV8EG49_9POAL|nr:Protein HAPLESS 2 [Rhynchospora pubera]
MGAAASQAANGLVGLLGNSVTAPFKALFGANCDGICAGTWDIVCFIEHLCLSNLFRLFMVSILSFITMFFVYLLFQVGILPCICRNCFKISFALCKAYFNAMEEISCFLCYKLRNTKRVYRQRFGDLEEGFSSSYGDDSSSESQIIPAYRRRRSVRERRKDHMRRSLDLRRLSSNGRSRRYKNGGSSRHHVRVKTREVSVHLKGSRGHRR